MNNEEKIRYENARRRVKTVKQFYIMIAAYIAVGGYLVFRRWDGNNIFGVENLHNNWLVLVWGIALIVYGITIFHPFFSQWQERKINELMKKYQNEKQ